MTPTDQIAQALLPRDGEVTLPCCADFPYCMGGEAGHLGWGEPSHDVRSGGSLGCMDTPHRPQAEWPWLKGSGPLESCLRYRGRTTGRGVVLRPIQQLEKKGDKKH